MGEPTSESWKIGGAAATDVIAAGLAAFPLTAERIVALPTRKQRTAVPLRRHTPFHELTESLDITSIQLLQLAAFHHGVTRDEAIAEAVGCTPDQLDRAARRLVAAELAVVLGGILTVTPDLEANIGLPHPLFDDHLDSINSDFLARACSLLGVEGGTRKAERAAAVRAALRDPAVIDASLARAVEGTTELFARALELTITHRFIPDRDEPNGAVPLDVLLPIDEYGYGARSMYHRNYGSRQVPMTPLAELSSRLIIGGNHWGRSVWVWYDVIYGRTGRVFAAWPSEPTPSPTRINATTTTPARIVTAIEELAEHLGPHPAEGKKSGDRRPPVKTWRSAAKATGNDPGVASVLGELAADLGLIYAVMLPSRGRGRSLEHPVAWRPNPVALAAWRGRALGTNWSAIVACWLTSDGTSRGTFDSIRRRLALAVLGSLPVGHGLGRAELGAVCAHRHTGLSGSADLDDILADMARLGMTCGGGVIGLTVAARALAEGPEAVEAVVGGTADTFVVQPDHSVIAPPDLDPRLAATLRRIALLESEGGATVWRLDPTRLARAATTLRPDEVAGFLRRHSSVPVPDAVIRFVSDAMSSSSPVAVRDAGCVVTSDDPAALADATRHKTAKLTVVAPGVAVSPLPTAKVMEILASKGVVLAASPSANAAGGATATGANPTKITDAANAWAVPQRDPNAPLDVPARIGLSAEAAAELAERLGRR